MEAARIRRELANLAMKNLSPSPNGTPESNAASGSGSSVGKRLRSKTAYTPSRTPSTKTPDPKAIKVLADTPGATKKSLFDDDAGALLLKPITLKLQNIAQSRPYYIFTYIGPQIYIHGAPGRVTNQVHLYMLLYSWSFFCSRDHSTQILIWNIARAPL